MANNEKLQLALEKDLETVRTTAEAALPSADFTQEKVLELIGNLPIENGGTGATTLNNFFTYKGYLTTKDANDMWETGIYRVIGDNVNVPGSAYGVLNVYLTEDYTVQIYISTDVNVGQHISMRTGSYESKTWNPWHLFYTDREVVPVSNGGTGKKTADEARENLNAQRRIPQYVSGEGADLDTDTFDFVLTTLTAKKHKALQDLGFGSFAFVWQFFYQEANNERGRTQFAKSYLTNKIATRYYSSNTKSWSNWDEIFTGDSIIPIGNGGTGANTRNNAFRNLSFLGDKPITSTAQDTTHKWRDLGTGYAWFGTNGAMINQPYTYMFVLNYVQGSDVFQIGSTQSDTNTVYFRSGNDSGWHKSWTPLLSYEYSNTDLTAGSSKLATGKVYFVYE